MLHNCQLIYRSLSYSSYSCKFSTPDHASTASHDFVTGSKDGSANINVLKKLIGCNVFSVADNRSFCERALLVQHLGNRRISGLAYDTLDQSKTINDDKGLPSMNSEAREWRHDSDKIQTNKLEWWMILKISLRTKVGVPKTLVKQKLRLHSLCFPRSCWLRLTWIHWFAFYF